MCWHIPVIRRNTGTRHLTSWQLITMGKYFTFLSQSQPKPALFPLRLVRGLRPLASPRRLPAARRGWGEPPRPPTGEEGGSSPSPVLPPVHLPDSPQVAAAGSAPPATPAAAPRPGTQPPPSRRPGLRRPTRPRRPRRGPYTVTWPEPRTTTGSGEYLRSCSSSARSSSSSSS